MREAPKPPFNLFVTRYPGECAACDAEIKPGDRVGRVLMARRRLGPVGAIWATADDPYPRVCCAACHVDAAISGDPSLRWDTTGVRGTTEFTRGDDT